MRHFWQFWFLAQILSAACLAQSSGTDGIKTGGVENTFSQTAEENIYKPGNGISEPKLTKSTDAQYPDANLGQSTRLNGACAIGLIVDPTGMPQHVHTIRCTSLLFEKSSIDAVNTYRFKPAQKSDGTPVSVQISALVQFHRHDASNKPNFCQPDGFAKSFLHLTLSTPKGAVTTEPDNEGFYLLSQDMVAPALIHFDDAGFCLAAFESEKASCEVPLSVDAKGKVRITGTALCSWSSLADL